VQALVAERDCRNAQKAAELDERRKRLEQEENELAKAIGAQYAVSPSVSASPVQSPAQVIP